MALLITLRPSSELL